MGIKFKPSTSVRQKDGSYVRTHNYIKATSVAALNESLESKNIPNRVKAKVRNELVRRESAKSIGSK